MASVMTTASSTAASTSSTVSPTTSPVGPVTTLDRHELNGIASTVETSGVGAVDPRYIATLVAQARAAGLSPTLIEVLLGRTEPPVARVRAFGRIAATLVARAA